MDTQKFTDEQVDALEIAYDAIMSHYEGAIARHRQYGDDEQEAYASGFYEAAAAIDHLIDGGPDSV